MGLSNVRGLCRAGDGVDWGVRRRRRDCAGGLFLGCVGEGCIGVVAWAGP